MTPVETARSPAGHGGLPSGFVQPPNGALPVSSSAPLPIAIDPDRAALLEQLVAGLDSDALHWLSVYSA
jgi:hypothetical protein